MSHGVFKPGPRSVAASVISIPAGTLLHRASDDAEPEPRTVHAFRIDRHLVTVAAFSRFVDDGGYDEPAHWSPEGWSWARDEQIAAPRFWGEPEWSAYLVANHPVVGASAFEAEAYASFVKGRLPTAEEHERACRGDDARAYPWGDTWRDDACCHRGVGPRNTVPVGTFPHGASPFGVHDLVGSVWQWTADPAPLPRGEGGRVVCGGAWNNLPWSIGCGRRNAYAPTARFSNLGFRCAYDDK